MSKARAIADLLDSAGKVTADDLDVGAIGGRRNLIINGGFDVWQRGTSFTLVTSGFHADRFRGRDGTFSRSTDVPAGEGFAYSVFYDNDGVRTSINMRQIIENGKRLTDGKPLTLSFWVKGSVNTTCNVDFGDTQTTSWSLTTSWTRVVVSVPAHANRNPSNIFGGGLYVDWNFGADYPDVHITGVQLELGKVATPFEHRSYGEELALCQRYYYSELGQPETIRMTTTINTYRVAGGTTWPTTMRVAPTAMVYSVGNETAGKINTYNASSTDVGVGMYVVGETTHGFKGVYGATNSGLTTGQWYSYKVTADAEL